MNEITEQQLLKQIYIHSKGLDFLTLSETQKVLSDITGIQYTETDLFALSEQGMLEILSRARLNINSILKTIQIYGGGENLLFKNINAQIYIKQFDYALSDNGFYHLPFDTLVSFESNVTGEHQHFYYDGYVPVQKQGGNITINQYQRFFRLLQPFNAQLYFSFTILNDYSIPINQLKISVEQLKSYLVNLMIKQPIKEINSYELKILELEKTIANLRQNQTKEITERAEITYLNIIYGLKEIVLSDGRNRNQTWIINKLLAENPNKAGISESNLRNKFAEANKLK